MKMCFQVTSPNRNNKNVEHADILRTSSHQVPSPSAQAPTESSDFALETREETKTALVGIAHWTQVNTIINCTGKVKEEAQRYYFPISHHFNETMEN